MAVRRGRDGSVWACNWECECVRSRFGTKSFRPSEAESSDDGVAPAEVRQARVSTQ